jgi:hypothetical protein
MFQCHGMLRITSNEHILLTLLRGFILINSNLMEEIAVLPKDIFVTHILPKLYSDLKSICKLLQVCKLWQQLIWEHLEVLDFHSVIDKITIESAILIVERAKNLKHLRIKNCDYPLLPVAHELNLVTHCSPNIETIDASRTAFRLSWLHKPIEPGSDVDVDPYSLQFPNLKTLILSNAGRYISDVTLHFIPANLKTLNLENCTRISAAGTIWFFLLYTNQNQVCRQLQKSVDNWK